MFIYIYIYIYVKKTEKQKNFKFIVYYERKSPLNVFHFNNK